jgi:hypothetical protein
MARNKTRRIRNLRDQIVELHDRIVEQQNVIASLTEQLAALRAKLPRKPYPKMLFARDGRTQVVASYAEDRALRGREPRQWSTDAAVGAEARQARDTAARATLRSAGIRRMLERR